MALVGNDLGDLLYELAVQSFADIDTSGNDLTDAQLAQMRAYWRSFATVVVTYIQANAEVATQVNVPVDLADAGLQSTAGAPPIPTLGPVVATALDGTGTGTVT